jgi:hypothetical protein
MPEPELTREPSQPATKPRDRRALSALRHGLTGQIYIFSPGEQAAYDKHCQGYHQSLAPEGPLEIDLAQSIADDRWRMKRAAALENSIFAAGITQPGDIVTDNDEVDAALAQGRVWVAEAGNLQLLTLYESRIQRRFERNMAQLRIIQSERKAALQRAVEQAALIQELAESKGETFDIETEFPLETLSPRFVFSTKQIAVLASIHRCLVAATDLHATPQNYRRRAA